MVPAALAIPNLVLGRYALFGEIASGGMASVHLGRIIGAAGFARTVAIKRLHPHVAHDPDFVSMFTDEARLAARIYHPNVVPTLDVVVADGELFLVMEYLHGDSFAHLLRVSIEQKRRAPVPVVLAIMSGVLHGLHAAHEAKDDRGRSLDLVHRDVSPQNVLVGVDGIARVIDFGVAKALGRLHTTREGQIKGKLGYMPPEQLHDEGVDRRTDVYAAGVILWEALAGQRLFSASSEGALLMRVLGDPILPPSTRVPELPPELDAVVMQALSRDAKKRYPTAREMALAIERVGPLASPSEVSAWVEDLAAPILAARREAVAAMEDASRGVALTPSGRTLAAARRSRSSIPSVTLVAARPLPPLDAIEEGTILESQVTPKVVLRTPRRWPWIPTVGAAVAMLAIVVVGLSNARRVTHTSADSHFVPAPSASVADASPPSTASAELTSPAASSSAPSDQTAPTSKRTSTKSRTAAPARPSACDPPFSIDASGRKHFKRECL